MSNQEVTVRKQPMRRCTGCGEHFPKKELIRILRTPDGDIVIDDGGKKSGRGAYICKSAACLRKARKSGRIARSLNCEIPEAVYDRMDEELLGHE